MANESVYDEDWDDVEAETKKAASSGGTFVPLKDDGDEVHVVFIQKAETRKEVSDKYGPQNKTCANVAVFDDNGGNFIGVKLLKLAPTHWTLFIENRNEYGGDSVFKIRRKGPAGFKDTKYPIFFIRKLTDEDKVLIAKEPRLGLWEKRPDEDNSGYPGSHTEDEMDNKVFMKECAGEASRLGWAPTKEALKTAIVVANKTFFGAFVPSASMTDWQKEKFLEALGAMEPGQEYGAIGVCVTDEEPVNLDEDVNFF